MPTDTRSATPAVQSPSKKRVREASTFEVIERVDARHGVHTSHGVYDTLDEARGCVAFDRLTDWEIWQGDHIVDVSEGPFRSSPPDDLALLRDGAKHEARVLDESIAEHARNALMLLDARWTTFNNATGHQLIAYESTTIASIRARLQNIVDLAEKPFVIAGQDLETYMQRIAEGAHL